MNGSTSSRSWSTASARLPYSGGYPDDLAAGLCGWRRCGEGYSVRPLRTLGAMRLRRADCSSPGITRRRRGRGFSYSWPTGDRVEDPEIVQRIRDLAIPPAWADVWICPYPNGHLQAIGTDVAGRKQYRYHDRWRERQDSQKFESMVAFARALPRLRETVATHLDGDGFSRERVIACSVGLLDRGFFRIGAEVGRSGDIETFGLTTMRKEHVTVDGDELCFTYPAKGGKRRVQSLVDADVRDLVAALRRRRHGSDELLAYKAGSPAARNGRWQDLTSRDVNEWIKEVTGADFSAKDFRTWNATVLAAVALAVSAPVATSKGGRRRAIRRACAEVGHYLGNTATVARTAYIDPRVFDRYESGWTIAGVLGDLGDISAVGSPSIHAHAEEAVTDLLAYDLGSDDVERATALVS